MENTTPETSEVSPVVTGDISEVTEKLDELKEVMQEEKEPEKILVNETEMTSDEILAEMLTTLQEQQADPEKEQLAITNAETEIEILQNIYAMLETQQATTLENQEITLENQNQLVEGNYFIGLSVIIAFAVYMFWNQLSKW